MNETEAHDYDVDKRYARIRVELLKQEYTDVVRVCEQFPGLPDGVTVYVEHIDAIDLKQSDSFNQCPNCGVASTVSDHSYWRCENKNCNVRSFDPTVNHTTDTKQ